MKKALVLASVWLCGIASHADARTHNLDSVKMRVELPNDWKTEQEGGLLTAMTPDEKLAVVFWEAAGVHNLDAALDRLGDELDKFIKDAQTTGEPEQIKINGLEAVLVDGTGKVEGKPIEWSVGIYQNGGRTLILLGFADAKSVKKYEAQLTQILKSLRKS